MRFPIRNIFPRWQIWVHCLSVHSFHLLPFCCYVLSVAQLLLFSGDFGITRLHSGTTCILEHFFRAYMFPFVHSTKSGADQLCTAPTCLKLFLSARWPAVFPRQHRIIPALRLKHRSGGCGTSLAVSALRIMRYCPKTSTYHASSLPRGRNFYTM